MAEAGFRLIRTVLVIVFIIFLPISDDHSGGTTPMVALWS